MNQNCPLQVNRSLQKAEKANYEIWIKPLNTNSNPSYNTFVEKITKLKWRKAI